MILQISVEDFSLKLEKFSYTFEKSIKITDATSQKIVSQRAQSASYAQEMREVILWKTLGL